MLMFLSRLFRSVLAAHAHVRAHVPVHVHVHVQLKSCTTKGPSQYVVQLPEGPFSCTASWKGPLLVQLFSCTCICACACICMCICICVYICSHLPTHHHHHHHHLPVVGAVRAWHLRQAATDAAAKVDEHRRSTSHAEWCRGWRTKQLSRQFASEKDKV